MAAAEKKKAAEMEAKFEKLFADNEFVMCGGIVMSSLNDRYEYVPSEGFPGCPSLVAMCNIDLDKPNLTKDERDKEFGLITPEDDIGTGAKLFLRVELGNEMEAINAMIYYLNERLGRETSGEEKARRHTQLLWRHRDVLLKDYKYQIRTNNKPFWTWEPRTIRGADIKYRPDIMQDDTMLRVKPRGPGSVASSTASGMSRAISHRDLGSDEDEGNSTENVPSGEGRQEATADESEQPPTGDPSAGGTETEALDPETTMTEEQEAATTTQEEEDTETPADVEAEAVPDAGKTDNQATPTRRRMDKVTVTDADIEAELEDIEISNPLGPALASLYTKLPEKVEDIPNPDTQVAALKVMALELRPYQNSYQLEMNKKRHPSILVSKPMSKNIAQREYNLIKKGVEERTKFENKQYEKRWNEAKKVALAKKRAALKEQEKEIKAREAQAKKDAIAAERRKAAEQKLLARQKEKEKAQQEKRAADEAASQEAANAGPDDSAIGDTEEAVVIARSDDSSSGSEVIAPTSSKSRSGAAPAPVTLPITPRSKRPYLPDNVTESRYGVILDRVSKLSNTLDDFKRQSEKSVEKIHGVLQKLAKAMDDIASDTNELSLQLLKKNFTDHMELIDQERRLLKFLPFDQIEPGMRKIMANKHAAKVIAEHIWTGLKTSGYDDADLQTVTTTAAKMVFSADLRAFMKVVKGGIEVVPDADEEGAKGFDRAPMPTEYIELFEKYVLPRWGGRLTPTKSPKKKNSRRSWMDMLASHLKYQREQYFYWVAHGCKNVDEYLNKRHNIRKAMYLHNTEVEQRMTTVPSLRQEKLWYIEQTSCCSTVEELENVPVNRTRATYPSTRGEEIDMEEAFDAVNKIVAMQNNLPESAAALFDLTQGSIPSAGEISKAIQDGLREKRSDYDFRGLGIEPADNLVENVTDEPSASRSRSTSVETGSRSGTQTPSADRSVSPKKRSAPKSASGPSGSPKKRVKGDAKKAPTPSKDKDKDTNRKEKSGGEE